MSLLRSALGSFVISQPKGANSPPQRRGNFVWQRRRSDVSPDCQNRENFSGLSRVIRCSLLSEGSNFEALIAPWISATRRLGALQRFHGTWKGNIVCPARTNSVGHDIYVHACIRRCFRVRIEFAFSSWFFASIIPLWSARENFFYRFSTSLLSELCFSNCSFVCSPLRVNHVEWLVTNYLLCMT